MTNFRLFTLLFSMIAMLSPCAGSDATMTAVASGGRARSSQANVSRRDEYFVVLVIKNTGHNDLILPKANLGPGVVHVDGRTKVTFEYFAETTADGTEIVPSACEFAPVHLKPGRAMVIQHELTIEPTQKVEDVVYEYRISPAVAHEWGFSEIQLSAHVIAAREVGPR